MNHLLLSLVTAAIVAVTSSVAVVPGSAEDVCPKHLTRDNYLQVFRDYCYVFYMYRSVEFAEAEKSCIQEGGAMVKIPNSDVQNFLQDKLRATYMVTDAVWIGLSDHNSDNKWEWVVDGTTATNYENWAPGQPGIAHGLGFEDCAAMEPTEGGKWHDYRCSDLLFIDYSHPFICQYGPLAPAVSPSVPSTIKLNVTTPIMDTTPFPSTTGGLTTAQPTTIPPTDPSNPPTDPSNTPMASSTTGRMTTGDSTVQPTTMPPTTMPPTTMPPTIPPTMPPTTMPATTMPPTTMPPTTMSPTTMPQTKVSSVMTSQAAMSKGDACPPFHCDKDCGLDGYKLDVKGCSLCDCDV